MKKAKKTDKILSPALVTYADGKKRLSTWLYDKKPDFCTIFYALNEIDSNNIMSVEWPVLKVELF